jgi:hypothetical protein
MNRPPAAPEHTGEDDVSKNNAERERAYRESRASFEERLLAKDTLPPTDDERRIGAYKDMLEPQVRDAVVALVQKGYVTVDSGYDPQRYDTGAQYLGFRKEMLDASLLSTIAARIAEAQVTPLLDSDERNDYLHLIPEKFLTLEQWKAVWDSVAAALPDKGAPAPLREQFIDKAGH